MPMRPVIPSVISNGQNWNFFVLKASKFIPVYSVVSTVISNSQSEKFFIIFFCKTSIYVIRGQKG